MNSVYNVKDAVDDRILRREHSIGSILIGAGRVSIEDSERILKLQAEKGFRYGDAGIELGVLTAKDIRFAMARQFEYPYLEPGDSLVSNQVMAAYEPFTQKVESLRALRSQLMIHWLEMEGERKTLAILSPDRGEGRSWLAANLAVVFSQLGERTLLIDADLRNSTQRSMFGISGKQGLAEILLGRASFTEVIQRVPALLDLSIITAGAPPPNPQEVLARREFEGLLNAVRDSYDVIIIDTPAATQCADGQLIASRAGSSLFVARLGSSRTKHLQRNIEMLLEAHIDIVGTVLLEH